MKMDSEIQLISQISRKLDTAQPDIRGRVLEYLYARYAEGKVAQMPPRKGDQLGVPGT